MVYKTIVITGASDGIGAIAARHLTALGHTVVLVGRSAEKTKALAAELNAPHHVADFSKLDDVRKLAQDLGEAYPKIDVLANNAGGIFGERTITADGFEKNLQVNYLAPYLLTRLLIDRVQAAHGSVINVSSESTWRYGNVDLADLNSEKEYKDERAYANAKLDLILFSKTLHARYADRGVNVVAIHPGNLSTNFAKGENSSWGAIYNSPLKHVFLKSPKKGAKTLLHFIEGAPGEHWIPGSYYHLTELATAKQTAPQADDLLLAQELENRTAAMLGMNAL